LARRQPGTRGATPAHPPELRDILVQEQQLAQFSSPGRYKKSNLFNLLSQETARYKRKNLFNLLSEELAMHKTSSLLTLLSQEIASTRGKPCSVSSEQPGDRKGPYKRLSLLTL
jgi:hypothetical protein